MIKQGFLRVRAIGLDSPRFVLYRRGRLAWNFSDWVSSVRNEFSN